MFRKYKLDFVSVPDCKTVQSSLVPDTAFSRLLQWLLLVTGYYWRENMTSSATPPTCPHVEPIKFFLQYCLVIQNGGRTRLVVLEVPLFSILLGLLGNELFRKTKLKIVTKRQQRLNAKVLILNAEKHQRHILMVKVSFRPKQNKQQVEELSLWVFF